MQSPEPSLGAHHTLTIGDTSIAYHKVDGQSPTVVFLGGFRSDMTGTKATALEARCRQQGRAFVRFDYQGHGASSGDFLHCTLSTWVNDALNVIDQLTRSPLVLVGSSMGGWIMLRVALQRRERIIGLVGIAPAPDFTHDLIRPHLSAAEKVALERDGVFFQPNEYGDPYPITRGLLDDGDHHRVLNGPIPLTCPVRLLQGMQDADVPWNTSLRLAEALESTDVRITLIKDGDHRLSRPQDLTLLTDAVQELTRQA